jgi:hypothetical protein
MIIEATMIISAEQARQYLADIEKRYEEGKSRKAKENNWKYNAARQMKRLEWNQDIDEYDYPLQFIADDPFRWE